MRRGRRVLRFVASFNSRMDQRFEALSLTGGDGIRTLGSAPPLRDRWFADSLRWREMDSNLRSRFKRNGR
jgi:hypothetical protein